MNFKSVYLVYPFSRTLITPEEVLQSYDQLVEEGCIQIVVDIAEAQELCKLSGNLHFQQVYLVPPEEYNSQQQSLDRMVLDLATAHEQISQLKTIIYELSKQLKNKV